MSDPASDDAARDPSMPPTMRLQKYLARCGVASRRASEDLMSAGRVTVNGQVMTKMGTKVVPASDDVRVDGEPVRWGGTHVVIALNKPIGFITTMSDPQGRPCVADLVPVDTYPALYPIGRLDADTSGLLVFTTDGDLGNRLLHPRYHVDKTYVATATGAVDDDAIRRLSEGVLLDDGMSAPARVELCGVEGDRSTVSITIHEGRKRQVRRMFDAVGYPLTALRRVSFGPVHLGDIPEGTWVVLEGADRDSLYAAAGLQPA